MRGKLEFLGNVIEIQYYFINDDTIEFEVNDKKYFTHYKSLII